MENKTPPSLYDYGDYYSESPERSSSPCDNGSVKEFGRVFLPTLYSLVFITGLVGNGLVVCVLRYQKSMTMTDICLLNVALSDLLFILTLPFWAHYAAVDGWVFGDFLCRAVHLMHQMGFYGNIFFIITMSVDRYLIIVHALTLARHRSVALGIVLAAVIWVCSLLASLPTVVFVQVKNESTVTCKPEFPDNRWRIFTFYELNVMGLIVPLVVMIFCYSRIIPTLVNIKTNQRHKVIRLVVIIIAVFFTFWTPFNIVVFLQSLKYLLYINDCEAMRRLDISLQWTETLAFTHSCLNPLIYAFAGQKFKRLVLKLLQKWTSACYRHERGMSFRTDISDRRSSVQSRSSEVSSVKLL